ATTSDPKAAQVSVLIRRAIELAAENKPAEADEAYRAALTAAEQWEGPEGWNVAGILEWQATFFRDQQRYDEAWAAAERGLLIRKQKVGPYHSQTAKLAGLLASIAFSQKSPSKARATSSNGDGCVGSPTVEGFRDHCGLCSKTVGSDAERAVALFRS